MSRENKSTIKHWPEEDRPHKKLIKYGSNMPNEHLLGILIGSRGRRSKKYGGLESEFA
jgi:DNA repair protein RadC